jgi:hypothetical protein
MKKNEYVFDIFAKKINCNKTFHFMKNLFGFSNFEVEKIENKSFDFIFY